MVPKVLCMVGSSGEELVDTSPPLGTGCHCHCASHGEDTSPDLGLQHYWMMCEGISPFIPLSKGFSA